MFAVMAIRFSEKHLMSLLATFLFGMSVGAVAAETSRELSGHVGGVEQMAFSPDSSRLVTTGRDGNALVWDVASGSIVTKIYKAATAAVCASFSADGKVLATGHRDGGIAFWDANSGSLLGTIPKRKDFFDGGEGHVFAVRSLDFSADGKLLVTGGDDTTVKIWDWLDRKEIRTFSSHQGNVWEVRFDRTTRSVASISVDGMLIISNEDGSVRRKIQLEILDTPLSAIDIDFSYDGKSVAVSFNQEVRVFEVTTGKLQRSLGHGLAVAFSPIGHQIAYPSEKIDVALHDLSTSKVKYVLPDHAGEISSLAFSPNGKVLAVANTRNGVVRLWDLNSTEADTSPLNARIVRRKWLGQKVFPKISHQEHPLRKMKWPMTVDSMEDDWLIMGEQRLRVSEAVLMKDAQLYFTHYLNESPNSDLALALRSLVAHEEGKYEKALEDQTKAIKVNPNEASYYKIRADTNVERGKLTEALIDYSKAIELDGSFVEPHFRRGVIELRLDRLNEALRDFSDAIKLDSTHFEAYAYRANVNTRLGNTDDALHDLDRSLEINSNQAETLSARAEILLANKHFDQAIADCTHALKIDPDMAKPHKIRAATYIAQGDQTAAGVDQREFQRLDPASPLHYRNRPILHFDFKKSLFFGSKMVTLAKNIDGGKFKSFNNLNSPVWGPKDNQFAYFHALMETNQYSLWRGKLSGELVEVLRPESNQYFQWYPAWSPDGTQLAIISVQTASGPQSHAVKFELLIVDTKSGEIKRRIRFPQGVIESAPLSPPNHMKWSPNGKYILISWESSVVVDFENERSLAVADGYTVADWCPDGESLLYFAFEKDETGSNYGPLSGLYRWSINNGSAEILADKDALARAGIEMAPGMFRIKLITSATNRHICIVAGTVRDFARVTEIRIYRAEERGRIDLTSPIRTWTLESELPVQVQWSPDDTHLACIMLNKWSTVTVETLRLSTGARMKIADVNFALAGQGVGALDFLGFGKFLSWSD